MKGRISMSQKELSRLEVITKVHKKRLTTLQASENLGFSTRQVKRLCAFCVHELGSLIYFGCGSRHSQSPQWPTKRSLLVIME